MSLATWLSRRITDRADHQLEVENARLRSELDAERVKRRIAELEVSLLSDVHARDVHRWRQEHPPQADET